MNSNLFLVDNQATLISTSEKPRIIDKNPSDLKSDEIATISRMKVKAGTDEHDHNLPILQTDVFNYISTSNSESSSRKGSGGVETFTFRPLEIKLINDESMEKVNPCCQIKLGLHTGRTVNANKGQGTHPTWSDLIVLERKNNEKHAKLKIKDSDSANSSDKIGDIKIDLSEIITKGKSTQWYTLNKGGKATGEILMEIEYQGYPTI